MLRIARNLIDCLGRMFFKYRPRAKKPLDVLRGSVLRFDRPTDPVAVEFYSLTSFDSPLRIATLNVGKTGGRIGMTICPGKKSASSISGHGWDRDLATDIQMIHAWGAQIVITLMESWELKQYQVPHLGQVVQSAGMTWQHLPIVDGQAPDAHWDAQWTSLHSKPLQAALLSGQSILIHCLGGRGRTGTVAARILMELGETADSAISGVRAVREGMIETAVQEQYLYNLIGQLNVNGDSP